jgi:hypothetical protein
MYIVAAPVAVNVPVPETVKLVAYRVPVEIVTVAPVGMVIFIT